MTVTEPTTAVDALIVGAGFSGLYVLHKLRDEMHLTARVMEAGGGVGGTWWWNRYPGARSDSDSYIYGFMFDEELWKEWRWSERYPEQHEVRAYLEHVAQRYDLLRDITFNTRVQSATFDEDTGLWTVTTDTSESIQAHHLIAAVGTLSVPNTPAFPGADNFGGESYHTGLWPHEKVDFTGKRVGVVGTGASAVQADPGHRQRGRRAHGLPEDGQLHPPCQQRAGTRRRAPGPARRLRRHPRTAPEFAVRTRADTLGEGRPGVD